MNAVQLPEDKASMKWCITMYNIVAIAPYVSVSVLSTVLYRKPLWATANMKIP